MRIYTYKQNHSKAGQIAKVITDQDTVELADLESCEDEALGPEDVYDYFYAEYGWSPEECNYIEGTLEEMKETAINSLTIFNNRPANSNNFYFIKVFENILAEIENW